MILRFIGIELIEFLSKPFYWLGLVLVSVLALAGLDQLALDRSEVRVLIVDSDPALEQGDYIKKLVREVSGTRTVVKGATADLEDMIDREKADIVLSRLGDRWQATLRSRSILDHRRLARAGFTIASVINRLTPWDAVISAETVSPAGYGRTVCELGARMCAVYRDIGHPRFAELCEDGTSGSLVEMRSAGACPNVSGAILRDAVGFDSQLREFCRTDIIDQDRTRGACRPANAPLLSSVVSMLSDPQSHTRVFVPRTICLIVVFVAFVVSCRSLLHETRNNTLMVVTAIGHGRLSSILIAKLALTVSFSVLLTLILLELSTLYFGMSLKPGFELMLLPIAMAALSSAMLGLSIALVVRNEIAVYAIGSMYLLILFILSGYIDELKETNSMLSVFSYVLPLKYIIAPFSAWMVMGDVAPMPEILPVSLLAQCLGSFVLLLFAMEYYRRSS